MPCTHLKELLADEGPFLKLEIEKYKLFLEHEFGRNVTKREAEIDYLTKRGETYLAGFKDCYCAHVCPDSKKCEVHKKIFKK